jgi:hypothetical protein
MHGRFKRGKPTSRNFTRNVLIQEYYSAHYSKETKIAIQVDEQEIIDWSYVTSDKLMFCR